MPRYDPVEAMAIAESMARTAKRWKQVAEAPRGVTWECNACSFSTTSTPSAEDHAVTETRTRPYAHILLERVDPKRKPRWRIHSPDGRTVRLMERA